LAAIAADGNRPRKHVERARIVRPRFRKTWNRSGGTCSTTALTAIKPLHRRAYSLHRRAADLATFVVSEIFCSPMLDRVSRPSLRMLLSR
jgi:hypothetical protein